MVNNYRASANVPASRVPYDDFEFSLIDPSDKRADVTRQQILNAAAHQFAHRPYSQVSLDDILADAKVTKGAMYFHFRSKYALAMAIIDDQLENGRTSANEILARRLSGLETLVDVAFLVGVQDVSDEVTRAGFNLLEGIGRSDNVQHKLLGSWVESFAVILRRAIDEGDVMDHVDPLSGGRLMVSLYMGLRQTSLLDDPRTFFTDLEQTLLMLLPGLADPDRMGYLKQFIKRRTTLATTTRAITSNLA